MTQGTLKINTENILPIIKKWLYSDKDIFIRELVSNACDAISKLKILSEQNECTYDANKMRIDLKIDKENKRLTITDTGIGMSAEEVEKYIAQLAFSGAEEFVDKYKSAKEKDQVIGHFGLGFYSAYMVASRVEINTLSYKEGAKPAFWSCDGGSAYTLEAGSHESRGTQIILHIEDEEFLDASRIRQILNRYCAFLPYPIYLNDEHLNHKDPLWLKAPSDCTDQEYLEFYRLLYPLEPDPIFWIHLNVDYPFHLKGILYFPKITERFDFHKNRIKLFCNRVFVSDNCQDLIPDYLMVLLGAIDSPDIPLNVSRSALQMDRTVRSLSNHISKKVADRLCAIYQSDKKQFTEHWPNIEMILKLGAMQDEKFYERIQNLLIWKNLSDEWVNIDPKQEKIFYTQDRASAFLNLYKEKGIEVLVAKGPLDTSLMNFLEMKHPPLKFQRVDGAIDDAILDPEKEKTLLDADGRSESSKICEFVRKTLSIDNLEVQAKSLSSPQLPALLVLDEQVRRLKDTMALTGQAIPPGITDKKTFVVNTNNSLVQSIYKQKNKKLAKEILLELYQLSQLSQKELPAQDLSNFVERTSHLLETLLQG